MLSQIRKFCKDGAQSSSMFDGATEKRGYLS